MEKELEQRQDRRYVLASKGGCLCSPVASADVSCGAKRRRRMKLRDSENSEVM